MLSLAAGCYGANRKYSSEHFSDVPLDVPSSDMIMCGTGHLNGNGNIKTRFWIFCKAYNKCCGAVRAYLSEHYCDDPLIEFLLKIMFCRLGNEQLHGNGTFCAMTYFGLVEGCSDSLVLFTEVHDWNINKHSTDICANLKEGIDKWLYSNQQALSASIISL